MAVFVEARTDPFVEARQRLASDMREHGRDYPVRRPLRGFQIKENTYAVIRIMDASGRFIPVIDAAGEILVEQEGKRYTTHYTNFLVQTVVEERREKQQIVDTFGDAYIFFFGEAPRILQVQGFLLNTADFNWRNEFWDNYERYFRGTRLVERGARLYLIYDDIIIEGYMLQAQATDNVGMPYVLQFGFAMFVTGYTNISATGDPNFPPIREVDYSGVSSYNQAVASSGQVLDSSVSRAESDQYLGSGGLLTDALKSRPNPFGEPSVASFMQGAKAALNGVGDMASKRTLPIRSAYVDNQDEFVDSPGETQAQLRAGKLLTIDKQWSTVDYAMDSAVGEFFNAADRRFWDLMGRGGRAQIEMRTRGAREPFLTGGSGAVIQATLRSVPFGMAVLPGDL